MSITASTLPRHQRLGSTCARRIAAGEWLNLWNEKTGRTPEPNLAYVWKARLGLETENLHAWWHSHTEKVEVRDPGNDAWTRAPLPPHHVSSIDRLVNGELADGEILELKHTHARADLRSSAEFYMAQLQWQMYVLDKPRLRFSIIAGNEEPEWGYVERDDAYIAKLVAQAEAFWWHVTADEPPEDVEVGDLAEDARVIRVNLLRPYDMTTSNEWAVLSAKFILHRCMAEPLKETEKAIKALVPDDASECGGHGVHFKRDKRGALRVTINEEQEEIYRRSVRDWCASQID